MTKAIIGMSYNDDGSLDNIHKKINSQANDERKKSSVTNHYFLRSAEDPLSQKFNYQVAGIPICAYIMMNMYKSELERIVIVGDKNTRKIFDEFINYFGVNSAYERFAFADEGNKWSLSSTHQNGIKKLGDNNENVLFMAGDLIFAFDIDRIIKSYVKGFDIQMNLNVMQNIYGKKFDSNVCPYNRRYHIKMMNGDLIKEQNWWFANLNDKYLNIVDLVFGARKTYGKENNNGKTGMQELIHSLFKPATISRIATYGLDGLAGFLLQKQKLKIFKKVSILSYSGISRLFSSVLGLKTRIKGDSGDFGCVADIDSYEDLAFCELLMKTNSDKTEIYPYFDELADFSSRIKNLDFIRAYPEYMNKWCNLFPLLEGMQLYDAKGKFCPGKQCNSIEERVDSIVDSRKKSVQAFKNSAISH